MRHRTCTVFHPNPSFHTFGFPQMSHKKYCTQIFLFHAQIAYPWPKSRSFTQHLHLVWVMLLKVFLPLDCLGGFADGWWLHCSPFWPCKALGSVLHSPLTRLSGFLPLLRWFWSLMSLFIFWIAWSLCPPNLKAVVTVLNSAAEICWYRTLIKILSRTPPKIEAQRCHFCPLSPTVQPVLVPVHLTTTGWFVQMNTSRTVIKSLAEIKGNYTHHLAFVHWAGGPTVGGFVRQEFLLVNPHGLHHPSRASQWSSGLSSPSTEVKLTVL